MGFDSPVHWLIVILIVALLFGGSRVGNLMGELGKGLRSFKQNLADPNEAKPAPQARIAEPMPMPAPPSAPVRETVVTETVVPRPAEPAMPPDIQRR
jgi:sec-independent protein translocase protein TatA